MQRWFFLEDPENSRLRKGKSENFGSEESETGPSTTINWTFRVEVSDLLPGETVCVTGSDEALGKWIPEKCVPLVQEENEDIWSVTVCIRALDVEYRYCICIIVEPGEQVIIRKWETNKKPRKVQKNDQQDRDVFGDYETYNRVDSGYLTKESAVQFKLFNNPLTLWRPRLASRTVYIKVTPVNLTRNSTDRPTTMAEALEESLSTDTQDQVEPPKHAHTVVACLNSDLDHEFQPQGQFGKEYNPNDLLVFETSVLDLKNIAFLVDLYIYRSLAVSGDPPYHVGFSYLLPSALKMSEGHTVLPVTSVKHRPIGQIELDYLVIKPMEYTCDMEVSYSRHWKKSWLGLEVGHRGLGNSFMVETKNCSEVRENTIASLKTAASHGADFVEFDVQLSKDLVPVIYHDFHVCISMKRKKELTHNDMLELPVKELTLEQLHFLKVYHLSEGKSRNPRFFDEDLEEHQPFPTLQQVLEVLDPVVGCNIEIKWSNQLNDGTQELDHSIDINIYLDTILDVVLKHGGNRRIIFSCFNPDICRMIRLKQNRFPVMFLTQGQTTRYPVYCDPRCQTIEAAVRFAVCSGILGINVHSEDVLRDGSQVRLAKEAGLVVFCWGDDNNDPANIKHFKTLGLHAIIYDKIDQYSNKEVKESIFLVEARESQRQLLLLAASNAESSTPAEPKMSERSLDVEKARQSLIGMSTATSLESLESVESDHCVPPHSTS